MRSCWLYRGRPIDGEGGRLDSAAYRLNWGDWRSYEFQPSLGPNEPFVRARLAEVNRRRKARLLSMRDLLVLCRKVGPEPLSCQWVEGARGWGWGYHDAVTTLALAVRLDEGRLVLGIGECPASRATPGRVWPTLAPWGRGRPETVRRKLAEWVAIRKSLWLVVVLQP